MIVRFTLNLYFCSSIAFLFSTGIVLLFTIIPHHRLRASLLTIPFFKVFWDLFFCMRSNWIYFHKEWLTLAPENSRTLSLFFFYKGAPGCGMHFSLHDSILFSLGDYLYEVAPKVATVLAFSLLLTSILLLTKGLIFFIKNRRIGFCKKSQIQNTPIYETLHPISSAVKGCFKPKIFFSSQFLNSLDEEEKLAVLNHEKSHIRWKDQILEHFLFFMSTIFWFLPFKKYLIKKMHFYQELACDQASKSPLSIATAMNKAIRTFHPPFSLSFHSPTVARTAFLLKHPTLPLPLWKKGVYLLIFGGVLSFILMSQFLPF